MYNIIWDYIDEHNLVHRDNHVELKDRDVALEVWESLKDNRNITNIRTSVKEDLYIVVTVVFANYGKQYDYLANEIAEVGSLAVVRTEEGFNVVSVVGCHKATKSQLESKLPFSRYKKVVGLVK